MGIYTSGGVGRDIFAGAVAGVAAVWVADKLDQAMYQSGGPASIRKTEAARPGGMDPAHVLAKRAADKVGATLSDPKDNAAGHTIHYGIAAGMGALYGLIRGMSPSITMARGSMFGVAMFVLKDEIGNTMMKTAGNPLSYPIRDHARGAAAHTLFGVVTDLVTRLLSPWRDEVVIETGPPLSERLDSGREYLGQQRDYVYEQGRTAVSQGRGLLEQGIRLAGQLAADARARLPEVDTSDLARQGQRYAGQGQRYAEQMASTVRSRMPDYDDAVGMAQAGRKRAARFASDVRSQVPDVDVAGLAKSGRRQASGLVDEARGYMPESSGLAALWKRLVG